MLVAIQGGSPQGGDPPCLHPVGIHTHTHILKVLVILIYIYAQYKFHTICKTTKPNMHKHISKPHQNANTFMLKPLTWTT